MEEKLELNQIVYTILKLQIEFGTYAYKERLPTIEEMAELLVVSIDTVRLAYRHLQQDGYITLSQSIGTEVNVLFTQMEIEENIQNFFAERKDTLLDICHSMSILFGNIQLQAWKNISEEDLCKIENINMEQYVSSSYSIILFLQTLYGSLKNDLLMLLVRRLNIIYLVPFFSIKDWKKYVDSEYANCECSSFSYKIKLRRENNWKELQSTIYNSMNGHYYSIISLYKSRITVPMPKTKITFAWSSYKKASQIFYSVGFEILISIVNGIYPKGDFLPSIKSLAKEKAVSLNTIRYSLSLLNDLGIVKTINGVGTQVLSMDQVAENCNFSSPIVQKRLLDCKQSLQLFALSCREIAALTISSIDEDGKRQWLEQLYMYERRGMLDLVSTFSLKYLVMAAPYHTIRTVYSELYNQLLWGVPLRGVKGSQEIVNAFYHPYYCALTDYLEKSDAEGFASVLEEVLYHEVESVTELLAEIGIKENGQKEEQE